MLSIMIQVHKGIDVSRAYLKLRGMEWNYKHPYKIVRQLLTLSIDYLDQIETFTNKELENIYQNANPTLLAEGELMHVLGIRLAMTLDPKKGGMDIHWSSYDADIEGVILGGDFKKCFGTSKSRFQNGFKKYFKRSNWRTKSQSNVICMTILGRS